MRLKQVSNDPGELARRLVSSARNLKELRSCMAAFPCLSADIKRTGKYFWIMSQMLRLEPSLLSTDELLELLADERSAELIPAKHDCQTVRDLAGRVLVGLDPDIAILTQVAKQCSAAVQQRALEQAQIRFPDHEAFRGMSSQV
jgi:hypothetical protein